MNNMTKAHLQEVCDQKGIQYAKSATKAELISLLEGTAKVAKEGKKFKGEY